MASIFGYKNAGLWKSCLNDYKELETEADASLKYCSDLVVPHDKESSDRLNRVYYTMADVDITVHAIRELIRGYDLDKLSEPDKIFMKQVLEAYRDLNRNRVKALESE